MEWTDQGIVLSFRRHGETSAIVTLLTQAHGRHAGLVRGGGGKHRRALLQPGNTLAARWRGRLPEHLGTYTCELMRAGAAEWLDDPGRLAALSAACALVETALPEREPHGALYGRLAALLDSLGGGDWPAAYVRWELAFLAELGFGLDLTRCAATGRNDQLAFVSPKTGRAVSLSAGEAYKDRLLALPAFLLSAAETGDAAAIADGFKLTGYFLERHVYAHHPKGPPPARDRLIQRLQNSSG